MVEVTELLRKWRAGDGAAGDRLTETVYAELRAMAARHLRRERSNHTLQPTALVNEAFLKLVDQREVEWQGRAHFFGVAACLMRRVLVDHARARHADKRGGGAVAVELFDMATPEPSLDLVRLDDALRALADLDAQQARIVELRFFGGLTVEETAEVVGCSPATVKREWTVARAWLLREVQG